MSNVENVTNWVTNFESSNIKKFGWNDSILYIKFKQGDTIYAYPNVEEAVFHAFELSSSKGQYFASVIKKQYPHFEKVGV